MLPRLRQALRLPPTRAQRAAAERDDLVRRLRREFEEVAREEADRIIAVVREVEHRARRDVHAEADRYALRTTERFVRDNLLTAPAFPNRFDTLRHALAHAPEHGMALEFGVFRGTTLKIIVEERGGDVHGFDSFEGLPEDWRPNRPAGYFRADLVPEVPGAGIVPGWFDETLPGFFAEHPGDVAFLHLDADLYSSTVTALEHAGPRLRPGSVVLFDEYFNYPGWEAHEHRAWREFVARHDVAFEYLCFTADNEQLAVRVTAIGSDAAEEVPAPPTP
ncbi:TylF/MycF/NovP-related O-methyltransferase [Saccharothrix australiensis]|uniref:Macrocin-O-methyltransferase TylF n=1 Tax=Saccharothrix australiensis TaxID=2072 RepID=A0A495W824_9PSEU|nr:TylF/MycF/NovP-related O-methyltransferase [Saccharothrix australiensis]RKT55958.1 macrocin-O-methyltransferase TylF [Saccharothrix australiensis]